MNNNVNLNFSLLDVSVVESNVQVDGDFAGRIEYSWESGFAVASNLEQIRISMRVRAADADNKTQLANLAMAVNFGVTGMNQLRNGDQLSLPHHVLQELFVLVSRMVTGALAMAAKGTALEKNPLPLLNAANFVMNQAEPA